LRDGEGHGVGVGSLLGLEDPGNVQAFKYAQELGEGFWVAGVALLVGLFTGNIPGAH
jgi:hypothetical protein